MTEYPHLQPIRLKTALPDEDIAALSEWGANVGAVMRRLVNERDHWKRGHDDLYRFCEGVKVERNENARQYASMAKVAREATADVAEMWEVLAFYADPDTYFAIGFFTDPPCGEFAEDFSTCEDDPVSPERMRPGKRAREVLDRMQKRNDAETKDRP